MKVCCRCKVEKPAAEFNKASRAKDGLQAHCRPCGKGYYADNRPTHLANVKQRQLRLRTTRYGHLLAYFKEHPCVDCGESDPVVLDFDHRDPELKTSTVSQLLRRGQSWEAILAEIEKCDVRCSNCHRRRTAKQFGWLRATDLLPVPA